MKPYKDYSKDPRWTVAMLFCSNLAPEVGARLFAECKRLSEKHGVDFKELFMSIPSGKILEFMTSSFLAFQDNEETADEGSRKVTEFINSLVRRAVTELCAKNHAHKE